MEEYPNNSHKSKELSEEEEEKTTEEPRVEKVVQGKVVRSKKGFLTNFIQGDLKGAMTYIAFDILIPAMKDMALDSFHQGIDFIFENESRGGRRYRSSSRSSEPKKSYIAYNRYGVVNNADERTHMSKRGRASHDFDELKFDTRADAVDVLDRLYDRLSRYESVSVMDLYDLAGETSNFIDSQWGWVSLSGSGVRQRRGYYILDLPRPEPLNRA